MPHHIVQVSGAMHLCEKVLVIYADTFSIKFCKRPGKCKPCSVNSVQLFILMKLRLRLRLNEAEAEAEAE